MHPSCRHKRAGNCSSDLLEVWHGKPEPTYVCGFHEQRFGVGAQSDKKVDDWLRHLRSDEAFYG